MSARRQCNYYLKNEVGRRPDGLAYISYLPSSDGSTSSSHLRRRSSSFVASSTALAFSSTSGRT